MISSNDANEPKAFAVFLAWPSVPFNDLFKPPVEAVAFLAESPAAVNPALACFAPLFLPNNLPKTPAITFASVMSFPIIIFITWMTGVNTAINPLPMIPNNCLNCSCKIRTWLAHVPLVFAKSPWAIDNWFNTKLYLKVVNSACDMSLTFLLIPWLNA